MADLVSNEAIKLIIKIPVPNCAELASQKLVTCEGNLVSGVYDLVGFLNVIFQFVIIAGITVVVFMAILEGFKILFYSPVASKIKDAKSNLTKLATTLIILMFSVVILNQINPDLINGKLNIENVVKISLCEDIKDKNICVSNNQCTWNNAYCVETASLRCQDLTIPDNCTPEHKCKWIDATSTCVNEPPPHSENTCVRAGSDNECYSIPGCMPADACVPKVPKDIKDPLYGVCKLATTPTTCTDTRCEWKHSCQTQADIYAQTCNSFKSAAACPTTHCIAVNQTNGQFLKCDNARKVGESCSHDSQCGSLAFCGKQSSICVAKLGINTLCDGLATTDDDNACQTGYCNDGVTAASSNQCENDL